MTGATGPTLDQRRARHAWDAVARVSADSGNSGRDYRREAKQLPLRILAAGLGHAVAFLAAKKRPAVSNDLSDWLLKKRRLPGTPPDAAGVCEAIVKGDSAFLQLATDEALDWLQWLNRFAEAELEDPED